MARLTASSVIASQGDSAVLATCVAGPLDSESSQIPGGGVPLTVDYRYLFILMLFPGKKLKDNKYLLRDSFLFFLEHMHLKVCFL